MSNTSTDRASTLTQRVAEEIRAMMGRRRLTGARLARELGVSDMWVSYRLRGVQPIDLDDLERIADALGVGVVDLLPREMVRPNAGSVRVQVTPDPMPMPASAERLTRCVPDVRSSAVGGILRRPKARQSAAQPIAA